MASLMLHVLGEERPTIRCHLFSLLRLGIPPIGLVVSSERAGTAVIRKCITQPLWHSLSRYASTTSWCSYVDFRFWVAGQH